MYSLTKNLVPAEPNEFRKTMSIARLNDKQQQEICNAIEPIIKRHMMDYPGITVRSILFAFDIHIGISVEDNQKTLVQMKEV